MSELDEPLSLDLNELHSALERAQGCLEEADYTQLKRGFECLSTLVRLLENKRTSIARLRQMVFGARTEKTPNKGAAEHCDNPGQEGNESKPKPKGHGRQPADAYRSASLVQCRHREISAGQACPHCERGKLYEQLEPGTLIRIVGQAPLGAIRYQLEKLRCHLCGELFTAPAPKQAGPEKYTPSASSMIALLKYGSGFPFNRLAAVQAQLGVPLPASTQWDVVKRAAAPLLPIYDELIRQGAQGELVHNDDTHMRVLELSDPQRRQEAFEALSSERSGVFTTGIICQHGPRTIALFFTGCQHAGENLARVLEQRAAELAPPIQMCDALSRNLPGELKAILANCMAHARRKFFDVVDHFPEPCLKVLDVFAKVYHHDAQTKRQALSPQERLRWHQEHSAPLMDGLQQWLTEQFEQRLVEPNSGLGTAIRYMLNHWHKLTRFLHVPGAPLDNNICERALKKAILHRKSALFFKTLNGARVGDLFMSLIHTCHFAGTDPFDYLNELQQHLDELAREPHQWMPWNYRDTLALAQPP